MVAEIGAGQGWWGGGWGEGRRIVAAVAVGWLEEVIWRQRKKRRGWGGEGGNEPSSVVINGLNWISVERLIGDCRPPEDGVEQNCEQNCLGLERVVTCRTVGVRATWPRWGQDEVLRGVVLLNCLEDCPRVDKAPHLASRRRDCESDRRHRRRISISSMGKDWCNRCKFYFFFPFSIPLSLSFSLSLFLELMSTYFRELAVLIGINLFSS